MAIWKNLVFCPHLFPRKTRALVYMERTAVARLRLKYFLCFFFARIFYKYIRILSFNNTFRAYSSQFIPKWYTKQSISPTVTAKMDSCAWLSTHPVYIISMYLRVLSYTGCAIITHPVYLISTVCDTEFVWLCVFFGNLLISQVILQLKGSNFLICFMRY